MKARIIKFFDSRKVETVFNNGYKPDKYCRISSRALPELHWYYDELYDHSTGKKVNKVSMNLLSQMGIPGLAVWLQDDASVSRSGITLCSYRYGIEGNKVIRDWFQNTYDLNPKIIEDKKEDGRVFYGLRFKNADSEKIYTLIRDYVVPPMWYKFEWLEYKFMYLPQHHCLNCGKRVITTVQHKHAGYCSLRCCLQIRNKYNKVKPYVPEIVYDLEIEDNHNYFADGILVHNCHMLKSLTAIRSKAVRQLSRYTPRILLLTGTPLLSRPAELFSLLNMVDPKEWPQWWGYAKKYCDMKQTRWGIDTSGASNVEELHQRIRKYFIRRTKDEILPDLPPKNFMEIPVQLSPDIAKEYNRAEEDFAYYLRSGGASDASIKKMLQAEKLTQLNVLRALSARGKIDTAKELIENIVESGEKVLVFGSFLEPVKRLQEALKVPSVVITGETPIPEREEIVRRFQEDPEVRVFFGSFKASGVGLTLTAASSVVTIDLPWNPADFNQAIDRCHRIGATHDSINIYKLISRDTVDETMLDILKEKQRVFDRVIEGKTADGIQREMVQGVIDSIAEKYA